MSESDNWNITSTENILQDIFIRIARFPYLNNVVIFDEARIGK